MIARDRPRRTRKSSDKAPTFVLDRFTWGAPDRLELAGTFANLDEPPAEPPVLVLSGAERSYRLPAAADEVSGVPENGEPWRAAFVWQEPPAAFQESTLELGPGLAVDLPEPRADGAEADDDELAVRMTELDSDPEPEAELEPEPELEAEPAPEQSTDLGSPGVERLRFEAELLAAREELRETAETLRRTEEELSRARADLDAEREGRAADAARFREGLAQVQASAEAALEAEQSATRQLGDDLKAALDEADAKEAELRGELDTAAAVWEDQQAAARAEIAELQERVEELTASAGDAERLRAELDAAHAEADEARHRIEAARDALDEALTGAQHVTASEATADEGG
jgi:hypothetical protein